MKEVYLFSGLGADKRVFEFINLSGFKVTYIEWIQPFNDEPIEAYATRILNQIKNSKPILIGVSFGGMVAVEIAKQIQVEKIILISSAKTKTDIPIIYRVFGQLGLFRFTPTYLLKKVNRLTFWLFGVQSKDHQELLKKIISETDTIFLRWAINQIINWKNQVIVKSLVVIHGNQDRILPNKKSEYEIEGGGHFMIVNRSIEISSIVRTIIS